MSTDQQKKGSAEDADKDYESRCDPNQEARWLKVVLLNLPEYSKVIEVRNQAKKVRSLA
jgi:hypothetical protein